MAQLNDDWALFWKLDKESGNPIPLSLAESIKYMDPEHSITFYTWAPKRISWIARGLRLKNNGSAHGAQPEQ